MNNDWDEADYQEYLANESSPALRRMERDYVPEHSPAAYDEMVRQDMEGLSQQTAHAIGMARSHYDELRAKSA